MTTTADAGVTNHSKAQKLAAQWGAATPRSMTKVLATLGPSTDGAEMMRKLIESGASLFRLNFSHGSFKDHAQRLGTLRSVAEEMSRAIAVVGDLPGPKIRVTRVPDGGIEIGAGQDILFRAGVAEAVPGDPPVFGCTYEKLIDEAKAGHRVLINDGAIRALVVDKEEGADGPQLRCRVTTGGLVSSSKGVNLPDSDISAPAITERDWECVRWAVKHGLDYLALSFVRRAEEVITLKRKIAELSGIDPDEAAHGDAPRSEMTPVIAKIEKPQAVENIEEIVEAADGIMVARGDLGVEMDLPMVPIIQKRIVAAARRHGTPCIIATQMLESMIENSAPTRAEVSDVANAILDGADAIMLSGETAVGKHPCQAVSMMRRVALATEEEQRSRPRRPTPPARLQESHHRLSALAHGVWHVVNDIDAKMVVCWSQTGRSAQLLSQMGLCVPITAFSSDRRATRRMALLGGVIPGFEPNPPLHRSDFAALVDRTLLSSGVAKPGDRVVALSGKPFGIAGVENTITVQVLGSASPF